MGADVRGCMRIWAPERGWCPMRVGPLCMESGKATGDTARAMSEQNVEVDRATFKAWNAWDMDALRDLYSPDIIMRHPEGWPEPGPFVGREAVMRQFEQLRETWDADAVEPIGDFIDVG